jgi:inorganic pyrophosphatase/exopolyphosphatase
LVQDLIERGTTAIELVLRASSTRGVLKLLTTTNEVEFLTEIARLAVSSLVSETLGLPGRTTAESRWMSTVSRLAWLVDTGKIRRKPGETRLQALLKLVSHKKESELRSMIYELESGEPV